MLRMSDPSYTFTGTLHSLVKAHEGPGGLRAPKCQDRILSQLRLDEFLGRLLGHGWTPINTDTIQIWMIPRRTAIAMASVRSFAPSFSMMCFMWTLTVASEMHRSSPISR